MEFSNFEKKFSVLVAVYHREDPNHFRTALNSIWDSQILKPSEIVLVKDGPLSPELNLVIEQFRKQAPLKVHSLEKNYGLGIALAEGINICSNELIARMDSDDISAPDRFSVQVQFMASNPEIDISGTDIAEFNNNAGEFCSYRKLPTQINDLKKFARRRNPLNHMTVIFKKSAVIRAGNYKPFPGYEDYLLWIKMLQQGSKIANIPKILVYARIGNNMYSRRQGYIFYKQELLLQKEFKQIGYIKNIDYCVNIFLRALPRLFPIWGLKLVYKFLRK
jgi:glycosyltransferase involved in cell wall biosynthesis